jgi:PAS domain S-box-containing protein
MTACSEESPIRVLLVDDEEDLLDIGRSFLRKEGLETCTALSGSQALDLLSRVDVDVIVSDYQMPAMDGIQFLREVRSRFGSIPFILFTGRGREEIVIQALNGGADSYLQKGGELDPQFVELGHRVRQAVERRKALTELKESEARLRRAEMMAHLGHWEIDLGSRVLSASEGASAIYGTKHRHLDLAAAQAFVLAEYRSMMDQALQELIENGTPYDVRFKVRRERDGLIVDIRSWAEYDAAKRRVFGVFQDITEPDGRK